MICGTNEDETSNCGEADSPTDEKEDSMSDSDAEEDAEKLIEKIKELRKQLSAWPRFYDGHVELIRALHSAGELLEAREAREQLNKHYPLSPELWLEWIQDEKAVSTTIEERAFVSSLLDRATKDYASVKVWTEYLLFSVGGGDIEATREVAERALAAVGTHIRDGELLWQSITCIEEEVFAGLSSEQQGEQVTPQQQQQQKKRLQSLYRRRFRVPLLNMDPELLLADAEKWFDGQIESYMKSDLQKTLEKLKMLEPFEEKLLQTEEDDAGNLAAYEEYLEHVKEKDGPVQLQTEEDDAGNLAAYEEYLEHVKEKDGPVQVQNLYERAVLRHPLNDGLWLGYVEWCSEQFGENTSLVTPVSERSVRNCPWSGALCSLYVDLLQREHQSNDFASLQQKIKTVVETCLTSLVGVESRALALHGSQMWLCYVVFLARRLRHAAALRGALPDAHSPLKTDDSATMDCDKAPTEDNRAEATRQCPSVAPESTASQPVPDDNEESLERQLERLRNACQRGVQMMRDNQGEDGSCEGDLPLCRVWADSEAKICRLDAARAVWNDVMAQTHYTGRADLWLEFIELERRYGSCKHARKLYRRALERVWNGVEAVAAAYERFEQTEGDVCSMEEFRRRYRARMLIVEKRRAEIKAKEEAASSKGNKKSGKQRNRAQVTSTEDSSNSRQRKRDATDFKDNKFVAQQHQNQRQKSPHQLDKTTGTLEAPQVSTASLKRQHSEASQELQPPHKRVKCAEEDGDDRRKVTVGKEAFTVFVSNLDFKTSIDSVKKVFEDCGPINSARLVKDFKGRSKGFGFVVFDSISALTKALQKDRTPINGRPVFVSNYDPDKQGHVFRYSTGEEKDKLFVRGLPYSMTEEEVKQAFEVHAPVKEIRLVTHRNGYSKGTCFIRFTDAATAESVRKAMDQTVLRDFTITVLISNPSAAKHTQQGNTSTPGNDKLLSNTSRPENTTESLGEKNSPTKSGPSNTRRPMLAFKPRALTQPAPQKQKTEVNGTKEAPKSNEDFRKLFANK
ncbi:LSM-interacting domain [Trinorchestia longiramus]|nr:LSM-interacting domain [Trinorchestia longiramus]